MTIQVDSRITEAVETDGVSKRFDFNFPLFKGDDDQGLEVRFVNELGYDVVDREDYSLVVGLENKGGHVLFHVAPEAGLSLVIAGKTPLDQSLDITNPGKFFAQSVERSLDKITSMIQEFVSTLDEETRQRINNDKDLKERLDIRFTELAASIDQRFQGKWTEMSDYLNSLLPMFFCIMRKEIDSYAQTGLIDVIDSRIAEIIDDVRNDAQAAIDNMMTDFNNQLSVKVQNFDVNANQTLINVQNQADEILEDSINAANRAEAAATRASLMGNIFPTPESGVDPVTGVADGAYFNVRSSSDESYVDEYQNVGGVPEATGKSYPSSAALANIQHNNLKERDADGAHPASAILDGSGLNQQQINNEIIYSSRFENIVAAEQYAFTQNKALHVNNSNSLAAPITFRVDVEFLDKGEIIQNGHSIVFDKNLKAGRHQIFKGAGAVTAPKCEEAYSDWFGAVADGYTYSIDNVNTTNNTYTVNGTSYAFGVSPTVTYTDATAALQKTIDLRAKKTVITDSGNGIYMVDTQNWLRFVGKFKRELVLEGQLKAIPTNALTGCVLLIQDVLKCKVTAKNKIVGNLLEHDLLNSSEYIHGYHIANAVDCDFEDLETEFHVGDGSYVAYVRAGDWLDTSKYTKNIRFNGGSHNYSRRTGHVIEIGKYIYHENVNYDNNGVVRGTGTWSGVDVEPFASDEIKVRYADHIYFDGCAARGNTKGGGIRFERVYNGAIRNCTLSKNWNGIELHRCGIVSEWSVSDKQVIVKSKGYIHVHDNHFEDNKFGLLCAYGLSQFNLHDNTFVNCKEADMVIRAINSNIHDNITNMSQGTELIHLINSNYERNKSIDFYPARDYPIAKFAIGTTQNYNHPAYELKGDVLVNTSIVSGGTGYTYENISVVVTGSSNGDNAKVYPVITGGVLTALQILHHGSGYNGGCMITVTGGTSNAVVKTFCESLSSTSRICDNEFKLSSNIDSSIGVTYSRQFGIIRNGNPIVRNNYFDPRLATISLLTSDRSTTKNIITFADPNVSQLLPLGTLVQQSDGLKVVTVAGSLRPCGELWSSGRTVKQGYVTHTTTGSSYMCVQDGVTGATEISGESDYITDGTAAWAFLFKFPTLQAVSFAT